MAGYNFPDNPFVGENFAPLNGPSWQWDGAVWKVSSIAPPLEAPEVAVGDDLPALGSWNGQLWWESDTGKLFVWFDDGSSQQWVQIIAPTLILDATDSLVRATGGSVLRALSDWFAGMGRNDNPPELGFWPDQTAANIWRLRDRVFIGDAGDYDGNFTQANGSWLGEPQELPDDGNVNQHWLESSAQLYSNHTQGGIAILGATRVGDQEALLAHTAIAVAGYAYANQDPGNVWGGYFEGVRDSLSTNAIFGLQASAKNLGELKTTSPYEMFVPGGTYGIWVAGGGRSIAEPVATAPSSVAISIGAGTARWIKGIVFGATGLEGTDGLNAGKAVAIEMGMGQAIKWRHAVEEYSTSGEIRSDNNQAASETRIVFDPTGLVIKCMDGSQANEVRIAEFPISPTAGIYPSLQAGMAGIHLVAVGDNADGHVNLTPKGTGVVMTHGSIQMNAMMAPISGGEVGTGLMLSNVPNFGMHFGSGIPLIVAQQGSLYLRTDGPANERLYVNEDSGARWAPLIDDMSSKADVTHVGAGGDAHPPVIPVGDVTVPAGQNGFMTAADKTKLDGLDLGIGASINHYYNTAGTTAWLKPANLVALEVWVQAGGGGGGGASSTLDQTAVGSGGAGGGGTYKFYDATALAALDPGGLGITLIVGPGGAGGTPASGLGATGGASSFGTLSTTGGVGGTTSGTSALVGYAAGAAPGTGTGGDENIQGGPGHVGIKAANAAGGPFVALGGVGGQAALGGGGGHPVASGVPGTNGIRGSGGAGGSSTNATGGASGGNGGTGYIKLREYY